jgi:hypothetical protein
LRTFPLFVNHFFYFTSDVLNYLTPSAILLAYLGFAGGWGTLFRRSRENPVLIVLYGMLLMLPAALMLPWHFPITMTVWGIGLTVTFLFATRPAQLPDWVWQINFAYGYFGVLMLLILAWTVNTGQPVLWIWIGLPASLMSVLVWKRAFNVYFRGRLTA